uniref:CRISPR system precrRNA processing endoribonuclease RAMP protein Cas6 n=1 Tax=candidate division WOR-3 bacterium TaxID=2052148 RepID=A0A7V3ZWF4_UNCW3
MKIAQLEVKFKVIGDLILPPYKGPLIRNAFGAALRKISCPFKEKECKECLLINKCVYSFIFETPRPEGAQIMRKYKNIPHPFIIEPPIDNNTHFQPNDTILFKLILIGKAIDFLPYFLYSFELMAEKGFNKGKGKLALSSINQGKNIIYDGKDKIVKNQLKEKILKIEKPKKVVKKIEVNFLTPLRILYEGKIAQSLDFHIFFRNLLRRIGLLFYFYSDKPLDINFKQLIDKAKDIKTEKANFERLNWHYYSFRQKRLVKMEGLVGKVIYYGNLTNFIPYLKIGEKLHVGKGTAFGLGKYKLKILS